MSYKTNQAFKIDNASFFQANSVKWTGAHVQEQLNALADSVPWVDQKVQMAALNYDCSLGALQEKTLTGNSSLTVSNPVAGKYYTLIKKGNFTLNLPSGEYSSSGTSLPAGVVLLTFMYDGNDYFFNFSVYTNT